MPLQIDGIVVSNKRIKSLYYFLGISCPLIADQIKPGQFVMVKVSDDRSPLLRRPFSVYKSYPVSHPEKGKKGCLFILYKKVGKGTRKMTTLKRGEKVDLIGPLGNGFILPPLPSSENIVLIGGGVGIVSLYPLAEAFKGRKLSVFIGGKTQHDILCVEDFKILNSNTFVATEDGSLGTQGTVVDLFLSKKKIFKKDEKCYLYACGPVAMLKALAGIKKLKNFICQASLEARMGCGFGACWGCVVKTNHPKTPYQRVCKEGPVFTLKDILWE
ncbi:MAG: dihydroorotate dehydrogenase electron transfer subunit [Candidatus Aminicenantes bacterium]|nr:dihydroorotate dehydrogenase electron transfer subunit [Candidatus Aminicenantes bacterium]